jgi:hypothetical protein
MEFSPDVEMRRVSSEAEEFFEKVLYDEEPLFVSDEATLWGVWMGDVDEMLERCYAHQVVDHAIEYVNGRAHTNGLENYWSLLKRGISGTYVSLEPFHLFRYLDEQAFRYNQRKDMNDFDRFQFAWGPVRIRRTKHDKLGVLIANKGLSSAPSFSIKARVTSTVSC